MLINKNKHVDKNMVALRMFFIFLHTVMLTIIYFKLKLNYDLD